MRPARQRFVATFSRRCDELACAAAATGDATARVEFVAAMRRLAGASRVAGFSEVSAAASALDQRARGTAAGPDALVAAIASLREAFARDEASPPAWALIVEEPTLPPTAEGMVLIADSDDVQRRAMSRHLESLGYDVQAVSRGDEVLPALREALPTAAIIDAQLPGLDGLSICRKVAAEPALAAVPILFTTAASSSDERLAAVLSDVADYLTKPIDLADLGARVATAIRRRTEAAAAVEPPRLARGELAYPDFVTRASKMLERTGGALALIQLPDGLGLRTATWLTGELRRDDLLGRYRDNLRLLLLPGLLARPAALHVSDLLARLSAGGISATAGIATADRPGERPFAVLLQEADARLTAQATAPPAPAAARGAVLSPGDRATRRHLNILIADDDEMARRHAERPLAHAGFRCRMAADGQQAVEELQRERPDLLVLELATSGLDGFQVLEAVRALGGPRPRVLVVSATPDEAAVRQAFSLGADDYLAKPFSPLTLLSRVRRLLR